MIIAIEENGILKCAPCISMHRKQQQEAYAILNVDLATIIYTHDDELDLAKSGRQCAVCHDAQWANYMPSALESNIKIRYVLHCHICEATISRSSKEKLLEMAKSEDWWGIRNYLYDDADDGEKKTDRYFDWALCLECRRYSYTFTRDPEPEY